MKRGQFILDNILGTPAAAAAARHPPAGGRRRRGSRTASRRLREVMEIHRSKPLCNSCHSRMDPLGLALENFNALGMWRDERAEAADRRLGQARSPARRSQDVRDLKQILKDEHRVDFYRCLTEKLLTYALGRGLEYNDVETVDRIVDRLEQRGRAVLRPADGRDRIGPVPEAAERLRRGRRDGRRPHRTTRPDGDQQP